MLSLYRPTATVARCRENMLNVYHPTATLCALPKRLLELVPAPLPPWRAGDKSMCNLYRPTAAVVRYGENMLSLYCPTATVAHCRENMLSLYSPTATWRTAQETCRLSLGLVQIVRTAPTQRGAVIAPNRQYIMDEWCKDSPTLAPRCRSGWVPESPMHILTCVVFPIRATSNPFPPCEFEK